MLYKCNNNYPLENNLYLEPSSFVIQSAFRNGRILRSRGSNLSII
jgi:hypothetical protein